uniref:RanBD1 domain-containing protein n=1 Tax=Lotharella oceanica TaxID=641309 RepID=A0A7S2TLP1_9EUKA|mmetsp:Transcript_18448/g.34825  ORF Transcript_18448/g.34825 Transcript_18448/m.34825 type:complete len:147 (+) Transcript_18448:71-511(+)
MSEVRNADSTAEFAPVVTGLQEVDNSDALKKIKTVYEQRSLLYFFSKEKTNWITRGKGNIRIQKHDESQFYQMVLYEEKTLKLRLCTIIHPANEMKANEGSDRAWAFACTDYSECRILECVDKTGLIIGCLSGRWKGQRPGLCHQI